MPISETLKKLLVLLADANFHSGTELAAAVGMSRTAIWKHLQLLADFGLDLKSVPGKGYRLIQPVQLLDSQQINRHLSSQAVQLISELQIHDSLESTNTYLQEKAKAGALSGTVCLAEYQSAGKGRRGRTWVSPFGHNIYVSILWRFQKGPAELSGLSLAMGMAVIRALRQIGLTDIGLKWPNDIYTQQRKLAGILIEVSGESGGPCHAVIGLGVNFYLAPQQMEKILQPCADISSLLGSQAYTRRNQLVGLLLNQMLMILADFESTGIRQYLPEWRSYDCMVGKQVDLCFGSQTQKGEVVGIDDNGLLLLKSENGKVQSYASGEVSIKLS
jgi:BirA family biotin operon repressor/biotin-[acetyl-CoA-carboxylase] ligase